MMEHCGMFGLCMVNHSLLSNFTHAFRVDARDNSILEEEEEQEDVVEENGLEGGSVEPHLMPFAGQKKKVILRTSQGGSLGLSIRGGKEYDLGVYVSRYSVALQPFVRFLHAHFFVAVSCRPEEMNDSNCIVIDLK